MFIYSFIDGSFNNIVSNSACLETCGRIIKETSCGLISGTILVFTRRNWVNCFQPSQLAQFMGMVEIQAEGSAVLKRMASPCSTDIHQIFKYAHIA